MLWSRRAAMSGTAKEVPRLKMTRRGVPLCMCVVQLSRREEEKGERVSSLLRGESVTTGGDGEGICVYMCVRRVFAGR